MTAVKICASFALFVTIIQAQSLSPLPASTTLQSLLSAGRSPAEPVHNLSFGDDNFKINITLFLNVTCPNTPISGYRPINGASSQLLGSLNTGTSDTAVTAYNDLDGIAEADRRTHLRYRVNELIVNTTEKGHTYFGLDNKSSIVSELRGRSSFLKGDYEMYMASGASNEKRGIGAGPTDNGIIYAFGAPDLLFSQPRGKSVDNIAIVAASLLFAITVQSFIAVYLSHGKTLESLDALVLAITLAQFEDFSTYMDNLVSSYQTLGPRRTVLAKPTAEDVDKALEIIGEGNLGNGSGASDELTGSLLAGHETQGIASITRLVQQIYQSAQCEG